MKICFRTQLLNLLSFVLLLCVSCAWFPPYVDSLPDQHVPTAEALLSGADGNRSFISILLPSANSSISAGVLDLNVIVWMDELMESGIDETTLRETINRSARLEINGQLFAPNDVGEHPPSMVGRQVWDEEFYYRVKLEEGYYVLTFSLETPDGETHSYTWAYRVE